MPSQAFATSAAFNISQVKAAALTASYCLVDLYSCQMSHLVEAILELLHALHCKLEGYCADRDD